MSAQQSLKKKVEAVPASEAEQASTGRRTREGVVSSNKMQKTIIVEVTRLEQHPEFKKTIKRKLKYSVHDEKNEAKKGDKVRIIETRPISKTKRWTLVQVLSK